MSVKQYSQKDSQENKKGWECPRCTKINSPEVKQCSCEKKEDANEEKPWQRIDE